MKLNINDIQVEQIKWLKKYLPVSHYIDIVVRIDGKDKKLQADWLKEIIKEIEI